MIDYDYSYIILIRIKTSTSVCVSDISRRQVTCSSKDSALLQLYHAAQWSSCNVQASRNNSNAS